MTALIMMISLRFEIGLNRSSIVFFRVNALLREGTLSLSDSHT